MTRTDTLQPVTADDNTIRTALESAHSPSLMASLVHLTGDMSILRGEIRPQMAFLGDPNAGITADQQAEIRALAFAVICRYRDNPRLPAPPGESAIREMLEEGLIDYIMDCQTFELEGVLSMHSNPHHVNTSPFTS